MSKRRTGRYVWILAPVCLAGFLVLLFIYRDKGFFDEALALPPELQSAVAIEHAFQSLPEEAAAPGAVKIPIFIYHSVRPYSDSDQQSLKDYEIRPELFEQQLQYLKDNGYTTITLDQVAAAIKSGTLPVAKPVVLTFDDGWRNQYKYAFPLLKKYNMTAVFYVYTNPIGRPDFLSWDNLKEMDAAGMTIADHSLSHPYFKTLSLAEVKREVTESKKILEAHLGKPVVHFASPYGYSNSAMMDIVKEAGYQTYRTTYKGVYQDNPLRLRGILVTDSLDYFIKMLK